MSRIYYSILMNASNRTVYSGSTIKIARTYEIVKYCTILFLSHKWIHEVRWWIKCFLNGSGA